jgi:cell fate regulator YaaT (PSP1 superfamily)
MKFVGAHYTLDGGQVILFFFAEDRVDFRQLLRQINDVLKVRVELRQIRTRDGAKITGGVGRCGRTLCCTMWLTSFSPVTIRMAKDQNLPISADGLSGQCGRLRCCLRYECEQYQALSKRLPRTNEIVVTPQGEGRVVDVHPIKETVTVAFGEGDARVLPLESITRKERPVNNTQQSQTQPAVQEEESPDTIES